jgi:hypothetical protein
MIEAQECNVDSLLAQEFPIPAIWRERRGSSGDRYKDQYNLEAVNPIAGRNDPVVEVASLFRITMHRLYR